MTERNTAKILELSSREKKEILLSMDFIYVEGGVVVMGTSKALVCRLEGRRWNETPIRETKIEPFWICKFKVTNSQFEKYHPLHKRPEQSLEDDMPVVDLTYIEALAFCKKISNDLGMSLRLPTEPEWVHAAAPKGWEYPYQPEAENPDINWGHTNADQFEHRVAKVGDPRWSLNFRGLDQMGHNVSELVFGHYRTGPGAFGAQDDGMYCIFKGGNYGHCKYTPGVNRRLLFDVADRSPRVGLRLAHDDI